MPDNGRAIANRTPRVVAITGASAGIGRAVARVFARQEQARIGLIARGVDGLEAARREIEELGGEALVLPADVADANAIEGAAAAVEEQLGPIDVWVNNAMASVFSPIKQMTPEEFKRVTEVTYLGYVHGTLAALKRMLPRNRGVIVQVGSAQRIAAFHCKAPTARPSTRSKVFAIRFAQNCCTTKATSA
jgi:NADP-dependent 3-hydroxy acid dehydrogenase YdfG